MPDYSDPFDCSDTFFGKDFVLKADILGCYQTSDDIKTKVMLKYEENILKR